MFRPMATLARKFFAACRQMSIGQVLLWSLLLAVFLEAITLVSRFGFDVQSTRDTGMIAACTCGIRIHHGYVGVVLLPFAWCFPPGLRQALWIMALGLIFSDLAHHFLVLWPLTGSPQFDLVYPQHPYWKESGSLPQP